MVHEKTLTMTVRAYEDAKQIAFSRGVDHARVQQHIIMQEVTSISVIIGAPKEEVRLPIERCGLGVSCSSDGVFLHFNTGDGNYLVFKVETLDNAPYNKRIKRALEDWCHEMQNKAAVIRRHAPPRPAPLR